MNAALLLDVNVLIATAWPTHQAHGRLWLSKIGNIKIKLHRPIKGDIKTLTIKRKNDRWYACFSVVVQPKPLPANDKAVGIDVGLSSFAVLSDGTEIANPRLLKNQRKQLRRAQRRVARRKTFSKRWRKAVRIVQKVHRKVFNQRNDFQHKLSREITNNYGLIVVEDLKVKGLSRGMLSGAVHDAGWRHSSQNCRTKLRNAGRSLLAVNARGTSQRCPCGEPNSKRLSDREHVAFGAAWSPHETMLPRWKY